MMTMHNKLILMYQNDDDDYARVTKRRSNKWKLYFSSDEERNSAHTRTICMAFFQTAPTMYRVCAAYLKYAQFPYGSVFMYML